MNKSAAFSQFYADLIHGVRRSSHSLVLLMLIVLLLTTACSMTRVPGTTEGCKIRTYIDLSLVDYVSTRHNSQERPRIAIFPFEVPETFAPPGNPSQNYGRELAAAVHKEFLRRGELGIVELFDRDRWPGKRAEFFTGNYGALQLARNAGYDYVVVGFMEDITNESDISISTKVIDASNGVTIWYGGTTAFTTARAWARRWNSWTLGRYPMKPDRFYFPERTGEFAACTVQRILNPAPVEDGDLQAPVNKGPKVPL